MVCCGKMKKFKKSLMKIYKNTLKMLIILLKILSKFYQSKD